MTSSIIDVLGLIGGFSSLILLIFGKISNYITEKMYYYEVSSKLYQVDTSKYDKEAKNIDDQDELKNSSFQSVDLPLEETKTNIKTMKSERSGKIFDKKGIIKSFLNRGTSKSAMEKRAKVIDQAFQSMSVRRCYNYSYKDV